MKNLQATVNIPLLKDIVYPTLSQTQKNIAEILKDDYNKPETWEIV